MATEATVTLREKMVFEARSASGHTLVLDSAPDFGGENQGPRPMELLLLGLGGCTGMPVIAMLRKMRQDVTGYEVRLTAERATQHPRVFTEIRLEHVVRGRNLNPDGIRRAIGLSATQYCPAAAMLGKTARLVEGYRAIDDATGAAGRGYVHRAPLQ